MYISISTLIGFFVVLIVLVLFAIAGFYISYLLKRQWYFSSNVFELLRGLKTYLTHLEQMASLTLYAGDQTLMAIVKHTRQMEEEVRFFMTGFTVYSEQELKDVYDEQLKTKLVEDAEKEAAEGQEEDPNKPKTVLNVTSITPPGTGAPQLIAQEEKKI